MRSFLKFKFIILLVAAFFRFYGLNWDQGYHLHPDERMIVMVTERLSLPKLANWQSLFTPQSPLNPQFFPYGSFPLYLLKVVSGIVSLVFGAQWSRYTHLPLVGRGLSVFFDLGTIYLLFKIGQQLFSPTIAVLASLFYAFCVFPIQVSHFYAVDVILNFFIWLTLWQLLEFYQTPSFQKAFKVGLCFGLALATKVSATVLVVGMGTALMGDFFLLGLKFWRQQKRKWWQKLLLALRKTPQKRFLRDIIQRLLGLGGTIVIVTVIVFFLSEPYALIDFPTFWQQIKQQHQMTKDAYVFPYTLQYVETTPYWFPLKNMILWGTGPVLGTTAILGAVWYLANLIKRLLAKGDYDREAQELIVVFFSLAYFLTVGSFKVKFMRYFLPLYPFFCLMAVFWFLFFIDFLRQKFGSQIGFLGGGLVVLLILLWPLAFVSIYSQPNTRVLASQWINQNLPQGSKIAVEHWDDRLPLWGHYQFLEMPMYDRDDSWAKWQQINQNLKEANYLILASHRLYRPLMKLADCQKYKICYPKTAQYYQRLFDEELGFRKIAEFTSYPRLTIGPWSLIINDEKADESFIVYDHPKVIIFKKDDSGFYLKNEP